MSQTNLSFIISNYPEIRKEVCDFLSPLEQSKLWQFKEYAHLWPLSGQQILIKLGPLCCDFAKSLDDLWLIFNRREQIVQYRKNLTISNFHACNIFKYKKMSLLDWQNIQLYFEILDLSNTKVDIERILCEIGTLDCTSLRFDENINYYSRAKQVDKLIIKSLINTSFQDKKALGWITFSQNATMFFNVNKLLSFENKYWDKLNSEHTCLMKLFSRETQYHKSIKKLYNDKCQTQELLFHNDTIVVYIQNLKTLLKKFQHNEKLLYFLLSNYQEDTLSFHHYFLGKCFNRNTKNRIWFSYRTISLFFDWFKDTMSIEKIKNILNEINTIQDISLVN